MNHKYFGLILMLAMGLRSATAADGQASWVVPTIPKPDADGWITLFDGEHLYGCAPTNECFKSGKVFLQNGSLWMDSSGLTFDLKASSVSFRIQARKVSGQNLGIHVGPYLAWFNGGQLFGIGTDANHRYEDLKSGRADGNFNDFFDMEFTAEGTKAVLKAKGVTVVKLQGTGIQSPASMGLWTLKGISVFKRVQVKLGDGKTPLLKDEPVPASETKPDATERLKKVKALYDQGLISKEDYDKKVKEILDAL